MLLCTALLRITQYSYFFLLVYWLFFIFYNGEGWIRDIQPWFIASFFTHLWSMLWSIDTCQNRVSVHQYHMIISRAQVKSSPKLRAFLTKCLFSIGSRFHVTLTYCRYGRVVGKRVDANPRLKVNRIIVFLVNKHFSLPLFCVFLEYLNSKQKTSIQSYKIQSKFSLILG